MKRRTPAELHVGALEYHVTALGQVQPLFRVRPGLFPIRPLEVRAEHGKHSKPFSRHPGIFRRPSLASIPRSLATFAPVSRNHKHHTSLVFLFGAG